MIIDKNPPSFKPQTEHFERLVRSNFERKAFMKHLGAILETVEPGACVVSVPFSSNLTQQNGFFHAGVTSTLLDATMGYAALSLATDKSNILTVEFKVNLVAPAKGDRLVARGEVVKFGRTLKICTASVYGFEGSKQTLCAISQGTMLILDE